MKVRVWIRSTRALALASLLTAFVAWSAPASAQVHIAPTDPDPDFLTFGAGAFDINDDWTSAAFSAEFESQRRLWIFHPITGVMVNTDMGGDVYAGVAIPLYFGNRWVVTPSFAPSFYWRGSSKNLGYPLEFRSSIAVAYRFDDRSRLGLDFYHLSNAGLNDHRNPGTEVLQLTYSVPFGHTNQ